MAVRNMKRLFIALTAIGLTLSACGANSNSGTEKPVTIKLVLWSNAPTVNAVKQINDDFQKQNPNITVEVQEAPTANYNELVQTRMAAKDVDILATQAFVGASTDWAPQADKPDWQKFIEAGALEPLDGKSFLKNYFPDAVKNASTYKGKVYGVETGSVAFNGVYYNMDLFNQSGLKPPSTWDEFITILNKLKSNNVTPLTMGGKDQWPQGLPFQGIFAANFADAGDIVQKIWKGEMKFTDPNYVKIYERTSQLWSYAPSSWVGTGYDEAMSLFANGKAAMLPDGTWRTTDILKANPNLKFGYFAIPSDKAGENNFLAGKYDLQWVVPSASKNKDAVMKWLDFFSESANYSKFANATGFIPTQPNVKLDIQGQATQDILKLSQNFKLALDQTTVTRKGIDGPGSFFDYDLMKPIGKLDPKDLASEAQKAFDSTASLNK